MNSVRRRIGLLLVSGLLVAGVPTHSLGADAKPLAAKTQDGAAQQGYAILEQLVRKGRDTGIASPADFARATLGVPLKVYHVDTRPLAAFNAGDNPAPLLIEEPAVFYPVMLDGNMTSSIRVQKVNGGWAPALVGDASLAATVGRAQAGFAPDTSDTALVAVLPLNVLFVAKIINSTWEFIPVGNEPRAGIKAGGRLSAGDAFARLAPLAKRLIGAPDRPS